MVGWDEIYHPDLPKSILIQSGRDRTRWGRWRRTVIRAFSQPVSTSISRNQPPTTTAMKLCRRAERRGCDSGHRQRPELGFLHAAPEGQAGGGSFTLVKGDAGWRGFIDFAGKSRRAVDNIQWRDDNQVTFTVDTGWVKRVRSFLLRTISSAAISRWVTPATRLAARVWTLCQRHTAGGAGPGERGQSARR